MGICPWDEKKLQEQGEEADKNQPNTTTEQNTTIINSLSNT